VHIREGDLVLGRRVRPHPYPVDQPVFGQILLDERTEHAGEAERLPRHARKHRGTVTNWPDAASGLCRWVVPLRMWPMMKTGGCPGPARCSASAVHARSVIVKGRRPTLLERFSIGRKIAGVGEVVGA
jgi:hypothetical protein